ncbi:hypothetical protein MTR_4g117060 [Medicago truncatula]|uniref:Uncharacterized protein n=1 Tax=Medicago truncatula TaxID=3880 RepID=A0A072UQR9_MEDTR|nr:hypothetical protein MTR_4g117060 [Medicago truncatula]
MTCGADNGDDFCHRNMTNVAPTISDQWHWLPDIAEGYTVSSSYQRLTSQDTAIVVPLYNLIWHKKGVFEALQVLDQTLSSSSFDNKVTWEDVIKMVEQVSKQATTDRAVKTDDPFRTGPNGLRALSGWVKKPG